jgi:hypothetical protein
MEKNNQDGMTSTPWPPSPKREGGKEKIIRHINPSPSGEGFRVRWISKMDWRGGFQARVGVR